MLAHRGTHILASPQIKANATDEEIADEVEKFKALSFIQKLNRSTKRYGALADILRKEDVLDRDAYPKSIKEVNKMMTTYQSNKKL